MKFQKAEELLKKMLIGNSYLRVCVGDCWGFYFNDGLCLVSQDVSSPEDENLNRLLAHAEPSILDGIDPEYITQGIIIHRNMRQEVSDITLADDGSLTLIFDQNRCICLTVDTDIVDWQWALSHTGGDPYAEYIVGCFWKNEVDIAK